MKKREYHGEGAHGSRSREYGIWTGMHRRCRRPSDANWHRYGGRGIKVCERWAQYSAFLADMGRAPPGMSIDRINNDGNYEPGNCRWATPAQQVHNRSDSFHIEYRGRTQPAAVWARELGIPYYTLRSRIKDLGWSVDRAFTERVQLAEGETRSSAWLADFNTKAQRDERGRNKSA